jgi:hypothetical protein
LGNTFVSKGVTQVDYTQRDVWQRLAALFDRALEPRPTAFCGWVCCDPDWTWRLQFVDYDLWFAIKGYGTMQLGEQTYPIQTGTLLCLRPGDTGWCVHDPADPLTVIYILLIFMRLRKRIMSSSTLPGCRLATSRHATLHTSKRGWIAPATCSKKPNFRSDTSPNGSATMTCSCSAASSSNATVCHHVWHGNRAEITGSVQNMTAFEHGQMRRAPP